MSGLDGLGWPEDDNEMNEMKTKQQIIEEQIEEIMDWFDFAKVAKVMDLLEWKWDSSDGVPKEPEIRRTARELLKEAGQDGRWVCTGGFRAMREDGVEHGKPWVRMMLSFELENWQMDGVNYEN